MESYQYNQQTVIKALCSNKKNVFLYTLNRIINNEDFAADFEDVNLKVKTKCNGESLLHRVLKYKDPVTLKFVKTFAKKNPKLLKEQRDSKEISEVGFYNFQGQSPLHVAIVNGYADAVKLILKIAAKDNMTKDLLCILATGKKFKNTVLMGQLPLSAAALVCRDENFDVLKILFQENMLENSRTEIEKDAARIIKDTLRTISNHARNIKDTLCTISNQNKEGDTVFHSMIQYADTHYDKMQHIEPTFKFIWERFAELCEELKLLKGEKEKKEEEEKEEKKEEKEKRKGEEKKECLKEPDITDIFSWENESGLTPLRLSAKFGVSELFKYLINIEGVYCFHNVKDGLFDIRKYDVTEFDR